ncbi:MAG TPA: hypothetical protein VMQ83_01355 [Gammaproteobacteria bacterium]|nr:hypothetical protein [Gammaproteobacteria bacterium]
MNDAADRYRKRVVDRVLGGPAATPGAARRAAFDNHGVDERVRALVDKVARSAWNVTDADVSTAQAAGMSDDEIFELVIAAALGQSTRQLDAALAALDAATHAGDAPSSEHGAIREEGETR